jgi:hypothetical protein
MNVIETRLSGNKATLDGVIHCLNRHMGTGPLARVELRYSTEARERMAPDRAKEAIRKLLLECGQKQVAVSVRSHDGPMDDATGDHVLRLIPSSQAAAARPMPVPRRRSGLMALLARWFPMFFAPADAAEDPPRVEPVGPVAMSRKDAVAELRRAIAQGCAYYRAGGMDSGPPQDPEAPVHAVALIVRLPALHAVLDPMIEAEQTSGHKFMRQALTIGGLTVGANLVVTYEFRERTQGDGTSYASDADVELAIRATGGGSVSPADGTLMPGQTGATRPAARTDTLMPGPGPRATLLTVRVLGTLEQTFAQPLVLRLTALPARLDRAALENAGLGKTHPDLLKVASNSAPLVVQSVQGGRITVNAPLRTGSDGAPLAMYYRHPSQAPLQGDVELGTGPQTLLVNSPAGVVDPAAGRVLPPLVVELAA